ncbi:MAG: replicative DNA helicase [bacterium]
MNTGKNIKLPPSDVEAEQSVLGALMIDRDAVFSVADILAPRHFYKKAHGIIYESMLALWGRNEPIDILSVTSELKKVDKLKDSGGSSYLTDLVNSVPTASHVEHYAKLVKEKSVLRDLVSASAEITNQVFSHTDSIDDLLDGIEQKIFAISQQSIAKNFVHIKEELATAFDRIEKLSSDEGKGIRGVPTGFPSLDNILSGLQKSDLIIIGARPSYGKTSLTLDFARQAAVEHGKSIGFFSLEMSREQIADRLIAAQGQIDLWKLRTGRIKDDRDFQMIQVALDKLNNAAIYVDDTPSPTIVQMRSMARRLQAEKKGLDLIVVDYLQLIRPRTSSDNTVTQVTEISRGLKGMARELGVPVIAVSQLSRNVEQRGKNESPRLSDLRESGSIEQDADVVMFVHPKNRGREDLSEEEQAVVDIVIAKHRNGPVGCIQLYFDKERASFRSIDVYHDTL